MAYVRVDPERDKARVKRAFARMIDACKAVSMGITAQSEFLMEVPSAPQDFELHITLRKVDPKVVQNMLIEEIFGMDEMGLEIAQQGGAHIIFRDLEGE